MEVSEKTIFLVGVGGEGGGAGVGWRGREVSEKRRFVVCAPMVFPTHGPQQTDAQTCADSDAFVPQPAAEDRLRFDSQRIYSTSHFLTRFFDHPMVQVVSNLAQGTTCDFWGLHEFSAN